MCVYMCEPTGVETTTNPYLDPVHTGVLHHDFLVLKDPLP